MAFDDGIDPLPRRAEVSAPKRVRVGAIALTALLHGVAVLALIHAFAPGLPGQVADQVLAAFTLAAPDPPPSPPPPSPDAKPEPAGAAPEGRKAVPKEAAAPAPKIVIASKAAPKVASTGNADSAGAGDRGEGTGAGGAGDGAGSGAGGTGTGGGAAAKAVKLSGDINSARDYPRATRDLRIGGHVDVALTVGADGRVKACRVARASRDPEADRITCRLATERFRFRPATDAGGNPVESVFGWRQRWFYPDKNS